MDGDCTFRHWKWPGAYSEQPWIDIQIFNVIRAKWVELKNADMKNQGLAHTPGSNLGGKTRRTHPRKR